MPDPATPKIVWDIIAKLIDKGFELLGRSEARRANFLKEVITPLHENFQKMYGEHLATFGRVRTMLRAADIPVRDILDYLSDRELFERGSVELIARASSAGPPMRTDAMRDMYASYVYSVARCLASPVAEADHSSVMYYAKLADILQDLQGASMLNARIASADRAKALETLEHIVTRFQQFYADVETEYSDLRARCAV